MPPNSSPRADCAVEKVLAGECTAAEAAKLCGMKKHEVQNIRKRVREEHERRATAAADAAAAQRAKKKHKPPKEPNTNAKEKAKHNFRHTVHQVDVINEGKHKWKRATIDAHKGATTEYKGLLASKRKRGDGSADDIVERFNAKLPAGAKPLSRQSAISQVQAGRAGMSPVHVRTGPARSLPQVRRWRTIPWPHSFRCGSSAATSRSRRR